MQTALTTNGTQELVKGVIDEVVAAVVGTMGPNGKLAFISVGTSVRVTKDGVSVAKSIRFDDPRQELINRVIVEPAIKTDTECGDGTTTTILLMARLYDLFCNFPGFRDQRFIENVVNRIIAKLKEAAITVDLQDERLFKLALTSSNSDVELSKIVTEIYAQSGGRHPEIELKEGQLATDRVVRSDGLPIKMHFSSPLFSKYKNGSDTDFTNFYPIIVDSNLGRGVNPIETISKLGAKYALLDTPAIILIVGRTVEQDLNSMLARINEQTDSVRFIGISTDVGGSVGTSLMQDIATIFDVPLFQDIEDALDHQLNPVTSVLTVNGTRAILKNIPAETAVAIQKRADEIQSELGGYELGDRFSVRAKFNETRIRNLRGELVTVFVGGETYSDVKERIDRFEDVVKAVKSALVNGVLPGIGSALARAGSHVLNEVHAELAINPIQGTDVERILRELGDICHASYNHLMKQTDVLGQYVRVSWVPLAEVKPLPCINLATGEMGTSEDLGVYDTAFAIVTALRGGLQTAKILANANSLILSDKLTAVMIKQ